MAELFLLDPALADAVRAAGIGGAEDLLRLGDPGETRRFVGFVDLAVAGTAGRFHLKRYRYRGWRESRGLLGRGTLWGTPPEINEYRVLASLREAGVSAVRPVAACSLRHRARLVAHALLTEVLEGAVDLAARLRAPDDPLAVSRTLRRAAATALGTELARMHAAGLVHRDCHARNVLVTLAGDDPAITFLDCRRGGRARRARDRLIDVATLDRDLRGVLTRGERRTALAAYLGPGRDAKAAVARLAGIRETLPPPRR